MAEARIYMFPIFFHQDTYGLSNCNVLIFFISENISVTLLEY